MLSSACTVCPQATPASFTPMAGKSLRDQIRASMIAQMLTIIKKPASERTPHEQTLFSWLQLLVQQNEIALYTNAIAESGRFFVDPCTFTLDSDIASAYNLRYNGLPFCGGQSTVFTPPVPAASYFTAFGFKNSYGAAAQQFKEFGTLMADTSLSLGAQAGISVGAGAVAATIAGVALVCQPCRRLGSVLKYNGRYRACLCCNGCGDIKFDCRRNGESNRNRQRCCGAGGDHPGRRHGRRGGGVATRDEH